MKHDVITFGSATVDIFAQTASSDVMHLCTDDHCEDLLGYHPGDKVLLEDVHVTTGGGGTNTAACFSALGLRTGFAGAIGRDEHGDLILDWMRKHEIPFMGPRVAEATNTSIILNSTSLHDRSILAYKGASDLLTIQDLDLEALQATWWYSSSLIKQSYKTLLELMRYADENGIAFAFNPSAYQTQHGLEAIRECVQRSTLLVCNKKEAEMLVGTGNRAEICRRLRKAGAEIICITEGNHGASMLYADTIYHITSEARRVVETTGAGDCFAATLVAGFIQQYAPQDALVRAALNAENAIQHVGAKNGLLSREELDELLALDAREVIEESQ